MRRTNDRFDRISKRLEALHALTLTPAAKRSAWSTYQATGRLPDDPVLRDLCEKLQAAEREFDQIHRLATEDELS